MDPAVIIQIQKYTTVTQHLPLLFLVISQLIFQMVSIEGMSLGTGFLVCHIFDSVCLFGSLDCVNSLVHCDKKILFEMLGKRNIRSFQS